MSIESRKITTVHIGALRAAGARPLYRGVFAPSAGLRRRSRGEDAAADRARSLAPLDPTAVRLFTFVLFRACLARSAFHPARAAQGARRSLSGDRVSGLVAGLCGYSWLAY